ncbi:hypothetical protein HanPI659440_Chr11g0410331 [Helianthus annuus]|nr:hypothetical protein HanPI659440_Chr11g0410331 [Helianthus annuus]
MNVEATEVFINQDPKCFCRCYLQIETETDVIVNNMAKTFNGYIIHSRSKHIINMLEDIRLAVMTRLVNKHSEMSRMWLFALRSKQKSLIKRRRGLIDVLCTLQATLCFKSSSLMMYFG